MLLPLGKIVMKYTCTSQSSVYSEIESKCCLLVHYFSIIFWVKTRYTFYSNSELYYDSSTSIFSIIPWFIVLEWNTLSHSYFPMFVRLVVRPGEVNLFLILLVLHASLNKIIINSFVVICRFHTMFVNYSCICLFNMNIRLSMTPVRQYMPVNV